MPNSKTGNAKPAPPGLNEKTTSRSGKVIAPPDTRATHPAPHILSRKEPRKVKVREDVDTDYAEEAEDFFYGEGM